MQGGGGRLGIEQPVGAEAEEGIGAGKEPQELRGPRSEGGTGT